MDISDMLLQIAGKHPVRQQLSQARVSPNANEQNAYLRDQGFIEELMCLSAYVIYGQPLMFKSITLNLTLLHSYTH